MLYVYILLLLLNWILAIVPIIYSKKQAQNVIFSLVAFSISFWILGNFGIWNSVNFLWWNRLAYSAATLVAGFLLLFVQYYPKKLGKTSLKKMVAIMVPTLTLSILSFTDFIVANMKTPHDVSFNIGNLIWTVFFLAYIIQVFRIVRKGIQEYSGIEKLRLQYFLAGLTLFISAALVTNLLLPSIGVSGYYHIGPLFAFVFIVISIYSVLKHELLDIKVVVNRTGAFLISLGIFTVGYLAFLIPYRQYVSDKIDLPFVLVSIAYGGLAVGLFFHKVQLKVQTTALKKFLKGHYDSEAVLRNIVTHTVVLSDPLSVLQTAGGMLCRELEISQIYLAINESHKLWIITEKDAQETDASSFKKVVDHFESTTQETVPCEHLMGLDEANSYLVSKGVVVPVYTFNHVKALFILGVKLTEEKYDIKDINLLNTVHHHLSVVIERITKAQELEQKAKELQNNIEKLSEANTRISNLYTEVKTLNTQLKQNSDAAIQKAKEMAHRASLAGLTMGIAHEIRNPLTSVYNGAETLQEKLLADGDYEYTLNPWDPVIQPHTFEPVTQDPNLSQKLYDWLKSNKFLTEKNIPDHREVNPFRGRPLNLPEEFQTYAKDINFLFFDTMKKNLVLEYLIEAERDCERVLNIAGAMLQYGATKGLQKELFMRITGFNEAMSEELWDELIERNYIDIYGSTLESFKIDMPDFEIELSEKYQPYAQVILDLVKTVPNTPREAVHLKEPLGNAIRMIQTNSLKLNTRRIDFSVDYTHSHDILGDNTRVFQVFSILLNNAIEAMLSEPVEKVLELKVKTADVEFTVPQGELTKGVMISIQDTGCGISPENIHKLRNPFFTTKGPTGGKNAGLGLSIMYEVVEKAGGRIDLESEEGKGTTFKVYFVAALQSKKDNEDIL